MICRELEIGQEQQRIGFHQAQCTPGQASPERVYVSLLVAFLMPTNNW